MVVDGRVGPMRRKSSFWARLGISSRDLFDIANLKLNHFFTNSYLYKAPHKSLGSYLR